MHKIDPQVTYMDGDEESLLVAGEELRLAAHAGKRQGAPPAVATLRKAAVHLRYVHGASACRYSLHLLVLLPAVATLRKELCK